MVPNAQLADSVVSLRPFLPARDFQVSRRFYADLGFELVPLGDKLVHVGLGTFAFLLQDFFVREWAENFKKNSLRRRAKTRGGGPRAQALAARAGYV